jgi:Restriction endonuclease HincII
MALVNYIALMELLCTNTVLKPLSGTLSGHAAGEPFDKHVYDIIKQQHQTTTFRQYEYLNDLFRKNPAVIGVAARRQLFESPTVMFLLSRGSSAMDKWNPDSPFEEKQNDTADILVVEGGYYELIDVKTRNMAKTAQPPNIILAYKLAQVCAKMFDNQEFTTFSLHYVQVDWEIEGAHLVCQQVYHAELFKAYPTDLYINWAAAMQIQFHVSTLNQNFDGTTQEWAKAYLSHFVEKARQRSATMIRDFVTPFEKYL